MNTKRIIEELLHEEESNTLDFKSEQYKFERASNDEKSELLKDILAFANAFRRTDAYILIGVEEVKGGRSRPIGVQNHIDDSRIQQFVKEKTNKKITFSYFAFEIDGKQIDIIHIPIQTRPFYLIKDFGGLKKDTVYIRRGSSTDIAKPDEIALMGNEPDSEPALSCYIMTGEYYELEKKEIFEKTINLDIEESRIPKLYSRGVFGGLTNSNYYQEFAIYYKNMALLREIKIGVRNSGDAVANDVKVVITTDAKFSELVLLRDDDDSLEKPEENIRIKIPIETHNDVFIDEYSSGWKIECHLGKIQAGDIIRSHNSIFIGVYQSKKVQLHVKIFSDDISAPISDSLIINFDVEQKYTDKFMELLR